jgi:hypothetical protein
MGSSDFFLCGLNLPLFFEEQLDTEQRVRVKTASGHAADFIDFGLGGRGGGREGGYAQRCRWCRAMDTNGILNRSTKPMPCSCCSCMLAPGSSVLGAMVRGMWERSAAVVILGTLDGLQGGHHVCCSAEAQQRAAAKRPSEEQRRPWTWRTPVRVRKAMPIWSRIAGSGSTARRHWHVPGACRACSAAAAAVFVSKHAPPPRPCHVTASPRHRA